jgi:hypothetical protein
MLDAIFDKSQIGRAKSGEGGDWGEVLRVLMGSKVRKIPPRLDSVNMYRLCCYYRPLLPLRFR